MRQELRVETGIGEFQQTPRGRGFSTTWFNSHLKAIQMVGAGMAEHFSPKDLELKAGLRDCLRTVLGLSFGAVFEQFGAEFFGTVFRQSGLNLWTAFEQFGTGNFGTVMGSPGSDFRTHVGPCVLLCVIMKNE